LIVIELERLAIARIASRVHPTQMNRSRGGKRRKSSDFQRVTGVLAALVCQGKSLEQLGIGHVAREDVDAKRRFAVFDIDQRDHAISDADRIADGKLELLRLHALPPAVVQTAPYPVERVPTIAIARHLVNGFRVSAETTNARAVAAKFFAGEHSRGAQRRQIVATRDAIAV
jgi:hypothetical protein